MKSFPFRLFFVFCFWEESKLEDVALCLSAFFACTNFINGRSRENGGMYICI